MKQEIITTNTSKFWKTINNYMVLARLTKPAPIFLLVFPGFWSIALNTKTSPFNDFLNIIYLYVAFLLGAILARSVGCIINDIADRKIDKLVERTKNRMIASNQISLPAAIIFALLLAVASIGVLITFNTFTIFLGLIGAALTIIYPFTKRFTYYPQVFLGITFSFGVLMGEAALNGCFSVPTILLYVACVFWVIGYDSIYAVQDYKNDKEAGIKSIVVAFGENIQSVVGYLYLASLLLLFAIGFFINASFVFYLILILVLFHFVWQVINININRPSMAGTIFSYNVYVGLLIWLAFLIG